MWEGEAQHAGAILGDVPENALPVGDELHQLLEQVLLKLLEPQQSWRRQRSSQIVIISNNLLQEYI